MENKPPFHQPDDPSAMVVSLHRGAVIDARPYIVERDKWLADIDKRLANPRHITVGRSVRPGAAGFSPRRSTFEKIADAIDSPRGFAFCLGFYLGVLFTSFMAAVWSGALS
jgi:hypothetical protein